MVCSVFHLEISIIKFRERFRSASICQGFTGNVLLIFSWPRNRSCPFSGLQRLCSFCSSSSSSCGFVIPTGFAHCLFGVFPALTTKGKIPRAGEWTLRACLAQTPEQHPSCHILQVKVSHGAILQSSCGELTQSLMERFAKQYDSAFQFTADVSSPICS